MIDIDSLQPVDYLRSGALIIAFLATAFADKNGESSIWLTADTLAGCALGTGLYLYPNVLLEYQVAVKSDVLIEYLVRSIGASLIGLSIIWYYASKNRDSAVTGAWLLTRSITGLAVFWIMNGATHMAADNKDYKFKDQNCTFGMLACLLWTAGNLIHLFKQDGFVSLRRESARNSRLNTAIIVDLILVGSLAISSLAFPEYFLKNLFAAKSTNGFHTYLFVLMEALMIGARLFMLLSVNFSNDDEKKAAFKAILWCTLLIFPWSAYYQHVLKIGLTQMPFFKGFFLLTVFNAMWGNGCFSCLANCSKCSCLNFLKV